MLQPPYEKQQTGEPYDLAGNRLVFTSFFHVKTGYFDWINDEGQSVFMRRTNEGPFDARFKRFDIPEGIRLVTRKAERVSPLIELEHPWEQRAAFTTVIREGGTYRAWGRCESLDYQTRGCYFESDDGINWRKPELGMVEFDGSSRNNLLTTAPGCVFIDPTAPQGERYKAVSEHYLSPAEFEEHLKERPDDWEPRALRPDCIPEMVCGIRGAVSLDGINWNVLPRPIVIEHSDTHVVCEYDNRLSKYVMYTRNYMIGPRSEKIAPEKCQMWHASGRRAIGRSESDDFRSFPFSDVVMQPGSDISPSDVFYTNCKTTIPGAPDHHIMFPTVWHVANDTTSVTVASSYNNRDWNFLPGGAILETVEFGAWDGGCIFAVPNLVELPNGDFALPYLAYTVPHKYPRGRWSYVPGYAIWPKGRLFGLEASESGQFATVAVIAPSTKLRINAVTKRVGNIQVEAVGLDGETIPGRSFAESVPIIGDQPQVPVVWKEHEDIGVGADEPVFFRFRMNQASIYALEFV